MYEWRQNNPQRFKEHLQKYRSSDSYKTKRKDYLKDKYHTDIHTRIAQLHRNRIRKALKDNTKCMKSLEMLGCPIDVAREWLEYNFTNDMSWENCGTYWHIDHITPCASFDLSQEDEQMICFHWTNIAPLKKEVNLKKGAKIQLEHIEKFQQKVEDFIKVNPLYSSLTNTATSSN